MKEHRPGFIFIERLKYVKGWANLKGYTSRQPKHTQTKAWVEEETYTYDSPQAESDWWKFQPEWSEPDHCFFLLMPKFEKVHIDLAFTPREFRGKGIASKGLKDLTDLCLKVNDECKKDTSNLFDFVTLSLTPCPVDVMGQVPPPPPNSEPEGEPDWTSDFQRHFLSESNRPLGKYCDKPRTTEQLIKLYEDAGFVDCRKLRYTLVDGEPIDARGKESFAIDRPSMIFPSGNADVVPVEVFDG